MCVSLSLSLSEREEGAAKQSKVHFVVRRDPNDVIKQIDAWLAQQGSPRNVRQ